MENRHPHANDRDPCGGDGGGVCSDSICSVLLDSNDWTDMVMPIPTGTDFAQQIISCQDTPGADG